MTRSIRIMLLGAGLLGALAFGATASHAAGIPTDAAIVKAAAPSLFIEVRHQRGHRYARYRYRPQVLVQPERTRGFYDPGYAYHGNINGCAVDLGYGRWESCNLH